MAGCPKCSVDLVRANPHKPTVTYPNGFLTFRDLRVGEELVLPDKWFSPAFDLFPPAYFAALPHPDGRTPGTGPGVLGDYATLDQAVIAVSTLASQGNQSFHDKADGVATLIDSSIQETNGISNAGVSWPATNARESTKWARSQNAVLGTELKGDDLDAVNKARLDVQNALSAALGMARIALDALTSSEWDVEVGDAVIEEPIPTPAPAPAPPRPAPRPPPAPAPTPSPAPSVVASTQEQGISAGAVLGLGALGVGVVGTAIYLVLKYPPRSRIRRVNDDDRSTR